MSWTTDIPITVEQTQSGTPIIRQLTYAPSITGNPAAAAVALGVKDAAGVWHEAVNVPPLRLVDEIAAPLEEPDPEAKPPALPASDFIAAIETARIDGSGVLAQRFGIADGTLLADALPQIAWGILYPQAARKAVKKGK